MPFDFPILYYIQENLVSPILNHIMVFVSSIGEYGIVWLLSAFIMLIFKKTRKCGVFIIFALILAFISGEVIIKNVVGRIRPCYQDLSVYMLVERPNSYSFPSGHSASSFAAAVAIFINYKKIGLFSLIVAGLIAFSRMYLFVHFPSDVFAGIALGVACAVITAVIYEKFFSRRFSESIG